MFQRHHIFTCQECTCERRFRKPRFRHLPHLLLTIVTGGIWSFRWLFLAIHWLYALPWRCTVCGHQLAKKKAPSLPRLARYRQLNKCAPGW